MDIEARQSDIYKPFPTAQLSSSFLQHPHSESSSTCLAFMRVPELGPRDTSAISRPPSSPLRKSRPRPRRRHPSLSPLWPDYRLPDLRNAGRSRCCNLGATHRRDFCSTPKPNRVRPTTIPFIYERFPRNTALRDGAGQRRSTARFPARLGCARDGSRPRYPDGPDPCARVSVQGSQVPAMDRRKGWARSRERGSAGTGKMYIGANPLGGKREHSRWTAWVLILGATKLWPQLCK